VAKAKKSKILRKPDIGADVELLKQHSKARTPVLKIAKVDRWVFHAGKPRALP
jgi:hypothetical protein